MSSRPTSVYRYYDRFDLLLYVGITDRGMTRNHEHNNRATWWRFVARQEVDHYETRREAEEREKALVIKFRPPFNTVYNPDAAALREVYLATLGIEAAEAIDVMGLYQRLAGTIPLSWEAQGSDLVFWTQPHHYPVASRLRFPPVDQFKMSGRRVMVRRLEMIGPFAVITLRVRGSLPMAATASAKLRAINLKQPAFEIRSVNLALCAEGSDVGTPFPLLSSIPPSLAPIQLAR